MSKYMKKFERFLTRKWLVRGVIAAVVIFFVIKAIHFFTAKPVPQVDYVAMFNELSCPGNFMNYQEDPNNAYEEYQNAFNYFIRFPRILQDIPFHYIDWPGDFNEVQQKRLESWLVLNEVSLESFHRAVHKPYYWRHYYSGNDGMMGIDLYGLSELRELVEMECWQSKREAWHGNYTGAVDIILDCYKAAKHLTDGRRILCETLNGCELRNLAVSSGFLIISQSRIDSRSLEIFQQRLEKLLKNDSVKIDFEIEKLFLYDVVQRMFHQNKDDDGKLAFRYFPSVNCLCDEGKYRMRRYIIQSFLGPTSSEMKQKIDKYLSGFESVAALTPYQVFSNTPQYFEKLESERKKDVLLDLVATNYERSLARIYEVRSRTEALITTIGIIRFKKDTGRLPKSLEELKKKNYISEIYPAPFSDEALVYRLLDGDFTLYSVGRNFKDDEGKPGFRPGIYPASCFPLAQEGDDIVFWPVKTSYAFYKAQRAYYEENKDKFRMQSPFLPTYKGSKSEQVDQNR